MVVEVRWGNIDRLSNEYACKSSLGKMETPNWIQIAADIRRLADTYADRLALDARQGVEHYLSHDEYEMAFEGLGIELMKVDQVIPEDRRSCTRLSRELGLDAESVFDANFWQKLLRFEAAAPLIPPSRQIDES